jgi:hypothetical protein
LEQYRGRHTIHCALPFFPADIGSDQEVFRHLRRHPLIPEDDRNGDALF